MSNILEYSVRTGSLLSNTNRIEAPFIRVTIGNYTFGVYDAKSKAVNQGNGVVVETKTTYPNYVQSLQVKKINGAVNQYRLSIKYPITQNDDPNFFERIFSTVSGTRKIIFTYGDSMMPDYVFRDEEGIITKVSTNFDIDSSVISYTIEAVSVSSLTLSGSYTFPAIFSKPSDVIKRLLKETKYHLTDVFKGMRDASLVEQKSMIASDDAKVQISTKTCISVLDYIAYLVSCMRPNGSTGTVNSNFYALTTYEDVSGEYKGPYFKVQKVEKAASVLNQLCTYNIDIGYPTANIVTKFNLKNDENWSIFYNYNKELGNSDYLKRIDSKGEVEYIYSPQLTGTNYSITAADKTWWSKVTQYPVKVNLTIKGLLKPAILMNYVKLNV